METETEQNGMLIHAAVYEYRTEDRLLNTARTLFSPTEGLTIECII